MLRSLNSGVSGLEQFQTRLDVIGNNIANANTYGFKSSRTDFAEAFSQTLQSASKSSTSLTSGIQVGSGVSTTSVATDYSNASSAKTGLDTDLYVNGDGFFVVKDTNSGAEYATRSGNFKVDSDGYLVTTSGMRVQGFTDGAQTARGDVKIDATGKTSGMKSWNIDGDGYVNITLQDGSNFKRSQITLQRFQDPQMLVHEGGNLFSGMSNAGALGATTPAGEVPGSNGLGMIQSGALEQSNVDLTSQFADLISTQRGFQANARIITTSDEILQELVNLKR
jgi:flagellar hook protein FlgE